MGHIVTAIRKKPGIVSGLGGQSVLCVSGHHLGRQPGRACRNSKLCGQVSRWTRWAHNPVALPNLGVALARHHQGNAGHTTDCPCQPCVDARRILGGLR